MKHLLILLALALPAMGREAYTNAAVPMLVTQDAAGIVLLHSSNALVHGVNLRYEPQTNKNTLGYWTKVDDWASWDFEVTRTGSYSVEILQGCGKKSGGAEVDLIVAQAGKTDGQTLAFTVQDTGHFQNFVARVVGTVILDAPGKYVLSVKPRKKPGAAVMDLRQVTLKPAEN